MTTASPTIFRSVLAPPTTPQGDATEVERLRAVEKAAAAFCLQFTSGTLKTISCRRPWQAPLCITLDIGLTQALLSAVANSFEAGTRF